jgi:8-oxo-dGTP pyrophosphatase MutT (NUDIX family)
VLPPAAINEGPPVTPRPSSTVVLVRDGDPWELLMVQRPGGADFAPGAYVFPGGSVHADDESYNDALRAAAVRELFEEAGILLVRGAVEADCARVRELIAGGESFPGALKSAGFTPDFDALVMFARWVTPAQLTTRYDARFYLARLPASQSVQPQEGEIVDWLWVSPAKALADPEITLVYATQAVLESIAGARNVQALFERARQMKEVPVVEPRIVQTERGWEIVRTNAAAQRPKGEIVRTIDRSEL